MDKTIKTQLIINNETDLDVFLLTELGLSKRVFSESELPLIY
ncbi:hypothetical protein Q91_0867 [Cycloclasticus sp. P1]|nr:hypothetical protein Q91_0867 [Cycloclasticus sp. P1]